MFNAADIIVIAIILAMGYISFKRGLICTVTGLFSNIISLIISRILYPPMTAILRNTQLYDGIKQTISKTFEINTQAATNKAQADLINSLNLPDMLKGSLLSNNNSAVYDILDAGGFNDYITGYMSNIVLSVISMIIVFAIANIIIAVICTLLISVKKLPVIGMFDSVGGAVLGVVQAVIVIWIVFVIITLFFGNPSVTELISNSAVASRLYDANIILDMVLKVIA